MALIPKHKPQTKKPRAPIPQELFLARFLASKYPYHQGTEVFQDYKKLIRSLRRLSLAWEKEAHGMVEEGSLPAYLLRMASQVKRRLPPSKKRAKY
jgi:hypothetical protein